MKKPLNPDRGGRGSFFPATDNRYRTPDQRDTIGRGLQMLKHEAEEEPAIVPRETCIAFADHEFIDSDRFLHSQICTKCDIVVEHPARWYAQHPPKLNDDYDLPPIETYDNE